jgi:hypothetical protein
MSDVIQKYLALHLSSKLCTSSIEPNNSTISTSSAEGSSSSSYIEDMMSLKVTSQNVTENVHVPTSEHVAEIVGRQGCKIKALRAKTNTYIKTPSRGEAPMFTITGRRDDVLVAKAEIQLAADHFTQIRASRRGSCNSSSSELSVFTGLSLSESIAASGGVLGDTSLINALMSTSPQRILSQGKYISTLHYI